MRRKASSQQKPLDPDINAEDQTYTKRSHSRQSRTAAELPALQPFQYRYPSVTLPMRIVLTNCYNLSIRLYAS